jgi:hypothetical protein
LRQIFGEKQSHQVLENTEERPVIGQNNPNFDPFLGRFESRRGLLKQGSGGQRDGWSEFWQEKDVSQRDEG